MICFRLQIKNLWTYLVFLVKHWFIFGSCDHVCMHICIFYRAYKSLSLMSTYDITLFKLVQYTENVKYDLL